MENTPLIMSSTMSINQSVDVNVTKIPVTVRPNCSTYNPCGRNGYCHNNLNDEWTCVCKFWWNGTTCHQMSKTGWQIIALGILLGILIIVFYGFALLRCIIKKRKELPDNESKQVVGLAHRQRSPLSATILSHSRRRLSWIIVVFTLALTLATLLIKWAILKPIHEEIVDKFLKGQPLYVKRHSICQIMDLVAEFNLLTFPIACLIILLFALMTKRNSLRCNQCCRGYMGIPIPVDFFAHVRRTLAAVIFAIFADELLSITNDALNGNTPSSSKGILLVYLLQILQVFVIGFRCYPILAAVYIDTWLSLLCATLYIWLDFSINVINSSLCHNTYYYSKDNINETDVNGTIIYFKYYGTGSILLLFQLLTDVPRYLCLAYISIKLPILLLKRVRHRHSYDDRLTREQKTLLYSSLPDSVESRYVRNLFGIPCSNSSVNCTSKFLRYVYVWRNDFRFSSRVVCIHTSVFLLLYFLTIQFCVQGPPLLENVREGCQDIANLISKLTHTPDPNLQYDENERSDFPLPDFVRPYVIAFIVALFVIVVQLLFMIAGIRRNLLQAYRGDDSEIPRYTSSENINYINGTFHFAGYLIGYIVLAYIFLAALIMIILLAIESLIIYGNVKFLERLLKIIIPTILLVFFKTFLNKILGQHVFLQSGGDVLSIHNRRVFMVLVYFNFFLDAFLGFVAALMRILRSIVGGILYMCRLDYSPLGRKLETADAGFSAYCGFIFVECAHRHPVLLYFVSHLLRSHLCPTSTSRLSKARHKWHLALFLLNNPILIYRRKTFLTRLQKDELRAMFIRRKIEKELCSVQLSTLAHRRSIISTKSLEELWEPQKF